MKNFWAFVTVITTIILSTTTFVTAQDQERPEAPKQAAPGWPNQADNPLKRGARQLGGPGNIIDKACDILCPDGIDEEFGIPTPYRAPRPTRGGFRLARLG